MELHVVINGRKDLAEQLYRQLRDAIESGRLAAGAQLPPSRLLAEQLGISRKTVSDTYSLLTYENFLIGRIGRGTFVNARPVKAERKQSAADLACAQSLEKWQELPTPLRHPTLEGTSRYEFIGGAICSDADIVVCNGAQQALDLIARVVLEPGSLVAMEDPGYTPARLLFSAQGATVVGVPVDDQGIQVERIPDGVRLIYVTPSHQFPLGMPMSHARREALLERARELGAIVIEDDYDSEFRYEGRPTDSLQSLDKRGVVAYVGTFSKTMLPQLRLGYAVLPPAILGAVIKAKRLTDCHTSTLPQWALAKFIAEGYLLKHIRRCHTVYAGRRERILRRLDGDLSPWLQAVPSTAGFHMAALCKVPVNIPLLLELAKKVEVGLYSLHGFFDQEPVREGLFIGFGAIETLDIDPALDKVRDLLQQIA
jgi:GntR family transcriptional regulator/MocR family aminotransferase